MNRPIGIMLSVGIALGLSAGAPAQSVVDWPPATGHMQFVPPSYPGPGAIGAQYVETFPSFAGMVEPQMAGAVHGGAYLNSRARQSAARATVHRRVPAPGRTTKAPACLPLPMTLPYRLVTFPGPARLSRQVMHHRAVMIAWNPDTTEALMDQTSTAATTRASR